MKPVPDVRSILLEVLAESVVETDVGVALSGGIDSTVVALALRELGKRVTAYSFTLDDRESTDFRTARNNAESLGIPFVGVPLPTERGRLRSDVERLVRFGLRRKTGIECAWPYLHTVARVTQPVLVTGAAADGHFGVSKKAMIHFRGRVADLDGYRLKLFSSPDYAQTKTVNRIGVELSGVRVFTPWRDWRFVEAFLGTSWEQVNRPRQKEPVRAAYPHDGLTVMARHTNLQLGDSGIARAFEVLLDDAALNPGRRYKSVTGVYNRIARGATR